MHVLTCTKLWLLLIGTEVKAHFRHRVKKVNKPSFGALFGESVALIRLEIGAVARELAPF
jgi:hypothetical protein